MLIALDLSPDSNSHTVATEFGMSGSVLSWFQSDFPDWKQFIKLFQHQLPEAILEVGVQQSSVLGPLLFSIYCSSMADVIVSHGIWYHQYADDMQLHLEMCSDNTPEGLAVLTACTTDVCAEQTPAESRQI